MYNSTDRLRQRRGYSLKVTVYRLLTKARSEKRVLDGFPVIGTSHICA